MRFRKLRIAWSVAWGVVAVLLCLLWVRSYWRRDVLAYGLSSSTTLFSGTTEGRLCLARVEAANGGDSNGFLYWNYPSTGVPAWETSHLRRFCGVRFKLEPTGTLLLDIPQAYVVFASIILAAAPWLRWSKNFSLRALLIATTVVAVLLGIIVWLSK